MDEFPSNSHTARDKPPPAAQMKKNPEAKKVEKIVSGEVVMRKRPLGTRMKEIFFGGNGRTVWNYVTMDVLIPAMKDMIVDAGRESIERMVFGESRGRGRTNFRGGGYTPYNRYSPTATSSSSPPWRPDRQDPREISRQGRAMHRFDEIFLESRGEGEEIIDQLNAIISEYQVASVADLYTMVGVSPAYTDGKYGWNDLRGATVARARGGMYWLNLPKPQQLD